MLQYWSYAYRLLICPIIFLNQGKEKGWIFLSKCWQPTPVFLSVTIIFWHQSSKINACKGGLQNSAGRLFLGPYRVINYRRACCPAGAIFSERSLGKSLGPYIRCFVFLCQKYKKQNTIKSQWLIRRWRTKQLAFDLIWNLVLVICYFRYIRVRVCLGLTQK